MTVFFVSEWSEVSFSIKRNFSVWSFPNDFVQSCKWGAFLSPLSLWYHSLLSAVFCFFFCTYLLFCIVLFLFLSFRVFPSDFPLLWHRVPAESSCCFQACDKSSVGRQLVTLDYTHCTELMTLAGKSLLFILLVLSFCVFILSPLLFLSPYLEFYLLT
jgi:hypothetical protein